LEAIPSQFFFPAATACVFDEAANAIETPEHEPTARIADLRDSFQLAD
jgi:hypothetical protein